MSTIITYLDEIELVSSKNRVVDNPESSVCSSKVGIRRYERVASVGAGLAFDLVAIGHGGGPAEDGTSRHLNIDVGWVALELRKLSKDTATGCTVYLSCDYLQF